MRVDLRTLQPNPMRDFALDPIDPARVEMLRQSIEDHDFWGGVVCRQVPGRAIEIACGHHRVEAAIKAGITEADIFIRQECSDAEMVKIYARENASQRGGSGTSMIGGVASALRILAKAVATEQVAKIFATSMKAMDSINGKAKDGAIGEDCINAFLGGIISLGDIRQALANLRSSGTYTRIMEEVAQEINLEKENAQALAESEALEAKRLEQARIEAEQRAQADEAASKEAGERHAPEEAETIQRNADIAREQAETYRKEAQKHEKAAERAQREAEQASKASEKAQKSSTAAAKREGNQRVFDLEGVSQHLKAAYHIQVFRQEVTGEQFRGVITLENQAALAQQIVERAQELGVQEVTGKYIRDEVKWMLGEAKQRAHIWSRQERTRLERDDRILKTRNLQMDFVKTLNSLDGIGYKLNLIYDAWPDGEELPYVDDFDPAIDRVLEIVTKIHDRRIVHAEISRRRPLTE